mmetsp:Transcript_556/g.1896  ORF Transcript_556/g.1896 Transcript_556/m.1896 type:complete len:169 (+) Transcript_556:114-620(+)|eukprot:CAMPEP_0198729714 /NCGR_PEP_ID=MMETSP1475-20131203/20649_1 /TAXON_ID= ORGANISM="Unidentified sp., Strain CCMP1999" /NCGR_SAMPLE_ID=MMETSP1475 /ASSEMBLY_ACC=CAM_ASM_001111 /LENGTH=168 /DNA_ID=CAMNT_0044492415 /DNA_START=78 /DNA_END=584 /DNA_ORIENTATION=-
MVQLMGDVQVRIARGKNLFTADGSAGSTYVEVHVDNNCVGRTKVVRRNSDPTWDKTFNIPMQGDVKVLKLYVYEKKLLSADVFVGVVCIQLARVIQKGKVSGQQTIWGDQMQKTGSMELKVSYDSMPDKQFVKSTSQVALAKPKSVKVPEKRKSGYLRRLSIGDGFRW